MNEIEIDFLNEPVYTIGHAAEKLGVAVPTLRMYEAAGLILPHRTKTQRRLYSRNDIKRLQVIIDMIRKQRLNIESIKYLCSLTPCWKMVDCEPEVRKTCPAYTESSTPCWLLDGACSKHGEIDCRNCAVYLACPKSLQNPKEFLKEFVND
jgi:MerR family transcriptional regulator/heat shock protein HspR